MEIGMMPTLNLDHHTLFRQPVTWIMSIACSRMSYAQATEQDWLKGSPLLPKYTLSAS
jgi:hypothetical protein